MNWFTGMAVDEIKKAYRKLAMEWHPDRNGAENATSMMQKINDAYHAALKGFHGKTYKAEGQKKDWTYYYNAKKEQAIIDKIDELLSKELSDGAEILLIGFWIWVTNTDKEIDYEPMKEAKMRWHSKRSAWYWRQSKRASTYNAGASLADIGNRYGVEVQSRDREEKEKRVALNAG